MPTSVCTFCMPCATAGRGHALQGCCRSLVKRSLCCCALVGNWLNLGTLCCRLTLKQCELLLLSPFPAPPPAHLHQHCAGLPIALDGGPVQRRAALLVRQAVAAVQHQQQPDAIRKPLVGRLGEWEREGRGGGFCQESAAASTDFQSGTMQLHS